MNIVFEPAPTGTTHFLRYASGYVVWCRIEAGQNNQLILSEWDSGNEYWVPGIHPVEFYQQAVGLASIDDLPCNPEMPIPGVAPVGATHCYHHGGETSWYQEAEGNLFVWRDGSWYASTQKSARDLVKVCPFGAVTILTQEVQLAERSDDGAEEPNAMAQRLLVALKSDPRSFDTGALAEMVELADTEIVKRDAAVLGGDGYLNNHWFERGELPPVGVKCLYVVSDRLSAEIEITAHTKLGICFIEVGKSNECYVLKAVELHRFRPIRTEHDRLMSILAEFDGSPGSAGRIADAILTDGFKRDGGKA